MNFREFLHGAGGEFSTFKPGIPGGHGRDIRRNLAIIIQIQNAADLAIRIDGTILQFALSKLTAYLL